jgi:hypothetical protein
LKRRRDSLLEDFTQDQCSGIRDVLLRIRIPAPYPVPCITFFSIFKDNKSLRNHKTVEIKVFSSFFLLMMEGSGSVQKYGSGPWRPKN